MPLLFLIVHFIMFLLFKSESFRIAALLSSIALQEMSTFLMSGFNLRYSARCSQKRLPRRLAEKSISCSFYVCESFRSMHIFEPALSSRRLSFKLRKISDELCLRA